MSPMMAPSMIDLLDARHRMAKSCVTALQPESGCHRMNTVKKNKKAGRGTRAWVLPGKSVRKDDSAKAKRLPSSRRQDADATHGSSRSRMRPSSIDGPARATVTARFFCTFPCDRHGNGRWAQPVWPFQRGFCWYRRRRAGLRRSPYDHCNGHHRKHHIYRSFPENRRWDTLA